MIWVKKFQSRIILTNELQKILVVFDTEYDRFCPCSQLLNEAKLQSFGLLVLAEATISRQSNRDFVVWLLLNTFMQGYNEKNSSSEKRIKNISI